MAKEVKRTTTKKSAAPAASSTGTVRKSRTKAQAVVLPTEDQIRARAYEIYLRRNGGHGDPLSDWTQAEMELREELAGR